LREPITSGRTWKEDPEGNPVAQIGIGSLSRWVRDDDERAVRAIFKWAPNAEGMYALGVERVVYGLGEHLGLPVPPTYLDGAEGVQGCAQVLIPGGAWKHVAAGASWLLDDIVNFDLIPLAVALDIWIGNPDRHERNIQIRPEPPDKKLALASKSSFWLVDNAHGCLWPPGKFDPNLADVAGVQVGADGEMTPDVEAQIGTSMPERYRNAYAGLVQADRDAHLDLVRAVSDSAIKDVLDEVPAPYFSSATRKLTMDLLKARRDAIGTLAAAVFP
jgi:hypothetical protein